MPKVGPDVADAMCKSPPTCTWRAESRTRCRRPEMRHRPDVRNISTFEPRALPVLEWARQRVQLERTGLRCGVANPVGIDVDPAGREESNAGLAVFA